MLSANLGGKERKTNITNNIPPPPPSLSLSGRKSVSFVANIYNEKTFLIGFVIFYAKANNVVLDNM